MQQFSELGVPARIVRSLAERDIHTPFPIQEHVLRAALAGRDILAKAPTGSGKTIAFAIPLVERVDARDNRPAAVVLVPTRELASQVAGEIEAIAPDGIVVATVYGGVPIHAQSKRARNAHIVVATPGRLNDLLERKAITLDSVKILVLDEADRMLDMGFKPQVDRIVRRMPGSRADDVLLGHARLDGGRARPRLHERSRSLRGCADRDGGAPRGRASLRLGQGRRQGRDPRRAPPGRSRPRARVRADASRCRSARQEARVPPGRRGRAPR